MGRAIHIALLLTAVGSVNSPHSEWPADHLTVKVQENVGQLSGQLVDGQHRAVFVGHAAVFLCDAATGIPIHKKTKRPILPNLGEPQIDQLWVAETNERGQFEFSDVPVGAYRLVAQSWSGTKGFPGFSSELHPSSNVILHGICPSIEVKESERVTAHVRQLGKNVLRITNDPEEAHALLLISLKPTAGDAILGPYGWGKAFIQDLVGVTQMEVPYVTIMGLPDDADVYVGLMNYDNNPGFGTGHYAAGQREGRLRIVASWSNGHKDPPPELVELTEHLETKQIPLESFLADENLKTNASKVGAHRALFDLLALENDRVISVEGLGDRRLADVLAAFGYIELRKLKK